MSSKGRVVFRTAKFADVALRDNPDVLWESHATRDGRGQPIILAYGTRDLMEH